MFQAGNMYTIINESDHAAAAAKTVASAAAFVFTAVNATASPLHSFWKRLQQQLRPQQQQKQHLF